LPIDYLIKVFDSFTKHLGSYKTIPEFISTLQPHQFPAAEVPTIQQQFKVNLKRGLNFFHVYYDQPEKLIGINISSPSRAVCEIFDLNRKLLARKKLKKGDNCLKIARENLVTGLIFEFETIESQQLIFRFEVDKDFLVCKLNEFNLNGVLHEASEIYPELSFPAFSEENIQNGSILNYLKKIELTRESEILFPANCKRSHNLKGEPIKDGVSMFVHLMNRNSNVVANLENWLTQNVDEIILLDWSSTPPVSSLPGIFEDPRVRVVRVDGEKKFIRTLAQNLATRVARFNKVFKCDSDVVFEGDFFSSHPLEEGTFWVGDWRQARDWNERSIVGNTFFHVEDFYRVNGYDERIETYGADDTNFCCRLILAGLKKKIFNYEQIKHVPHPTRTEGSGINHPLIQIKLNQLRTHKRALWSPKHELSDFDLIRISDRLMTFERKNKSPQAEILSESEIYKLVDQIFIWHHPKSLQCSLSTSEKLDAIAKSPKYWGNDVPSN